MQVDIKEKIKNSHYYKFQGIAPEGFELIPSEILEKLKDFETWKEWRNNPEYLTELIKDYCSKI